MSKVNRDLIMRKIVHSKELTAIEKIYLERLVKSTPSQTGGAWNLYVKEYAVNYYACSACNELAIRKYKFCPNCGTKMNGVR